MEIMSEIKKLRNINFNNILFT